jgi:hypothetical protein
MDDQERDYFRHTIRALERGKRRWQIAAICLMAALAVFLSLGTGSVLLFGLAGQRMRVHEARARAEEARAQAQAEAARVQALEADAARRIAESKARAGKDAEKQGNP